jgi:hypothetical protein
VSAPAAAPKEASTAINRKKRAGKIMTENEVRNARVWCRSAWSASHMHVLSCGAALATALALHQAYAAALSICKAREGAASVRGAADDASAPAFRLVSLRNDGCVTRRDGWCLAVRSHRCVV